MFGCVEDEECAYGHIVWKSKDSVDNLYVYESELCYECVDVLGSYRLIYSQECEDCSDGIGLFDCRGCQNCIGCVGLRQKSHHIFNQPVSKEEHERFLMEHPLSDPKTVPFILEKQRELRRQLPQRFFFGSQNSNVSGNHIYNSKNVHYSFDIKQGEDAKYVFTGKELKDVRDGSFLGTNSELGYQILTCGGKNIFFSHFCVDSHDIYYSDNCYGSGDLFGCSGLRSKNYCILNKQYTKEDYLALKERVIEHMRKTGEWGDFFPVSLSPFAYNEAIAQEYSPLSKEQALSQGLGWAENVPATSGQETKTFKELPQDPQLFTEELLKEVLKCDKCGHNYRLIPQEITFYKRMSLSLPSECFNCRHARRMSLRNPRSLWPGKCARCGAEFETSYSPEGQGEYKIYCEACYQAEMI